MSNPESKSSFEELITKIDLAANGVQRERGNMFEEVVKSYLLNEPKYKNLYDAVWLLKEVPAEYGIPKKDIGVDLVARYRGTDNLTAVQAKYYRGKVGKDTINSYVAELNKNYYADGLLVATTNDWNRNAMAALGDGSKEIQVIGLSDLKNSNFDWGQFTFGDADKVIKASHKQPREYQREAIEKTVAYFDNHERGKLIMAPGTGKTFTSLKIAEALAQHEKKDDYFVLYLVPSIQLLSQTLRSWNNDVSEDTDLVSFAVTSDRNASRQRTFNNDDDSDMNIQDIGFPASTNAEKLLDNFKSLRPATNGRLTVIFSTYQSIDVIHRAQGLGYPEFDLIIADEAHRTTGAHEANKEAGMFTKVHSNKNVSAHHRLYQTATPKIYTQETKKKGEEDNVVIASMDDPDLYGEEIYRLGFGEAVAKGILTDYKVEVLAVDESVIQRDMQSSLADDNGLRIDDIGKIIGVWNAMMKRESFSNKVEGAPMQRAIAFASVIDNTRGHGEGKVGSKQIAAQFNAVVNEYLGEDNPNECHIDVRHVDGSMNALEKKDAIDWLSADMPDDEARVLSNVKFLTEGIDVPNLDAIIFFAPKQSQIDIVQAVGRIMRKYQNKEYGYIILPVVVPTGENPDTVLDNNKTYKAVWQVLNALRSIDERFEAKINKLDLNKKKPGNLNVIGVGGAPTEDLGGDGSGKGKDNDPVNTEQLDLELNWHEIQNAIYGRIVKKVGDRRYLEDWTADVQNLAERHIRWIKNLVADKQSPFTKSFRKYVKSLQHNINSDIDDNQAIEMLAQHIITKPIFDALFDQYSFVNDNPVSRAMQDMVEEMKAVGFEQEQAALQPFYESVKLRASGIDNAAAKQQFIVTLYDKFFSKGFSATAEKLGIVFTPVQIVDFIVRSVDEVLKEHFGRGLAAENVHVLDPFTGTGTFIARTLEYLNQEMKRGEITLADITRKYTQELHANEYVLLSYYIAAVNIEAVFDEINGPEEYVPFDGIVLTDTFESTEHNETLSGDMFGGNNRRLRKEQEVPITAIISNPPYSVGQRNQNDNNQNTHYEMLENRIAATYVKNSTAGLTGGLYDSYIKAFRWASDRLGEKGVIGFVTNGGYLDSQSASGMRKSFYEEFNGIYVYNLRGNARTSGEQRRKEKDNVFGQGTRTPIAIIVLVKDGSNEHHLFYKDIGDYLTRQQKFDAISKASAVSGIDWHEIVPDVNNDWLNQRDAHYQEYTPLADEGSIRGVFPKNAMGIQTNRDAWVYGFSREGTAKQVAMLIEHYNYERNRTYKTDAAFNLDPKYMKWTRKLEKLARKNEEIDFDKNKLRLSLYRPFTKKWLYYDNAVNEETRLYYKQFGNKNEVIFTSGRGASKNFSVLATDLIPNMHLQDTGQGFMRYNNEQDENELVPDTDNVSVAFATELGLTTDETYAYVYGLLNSLEYQQKYANDLKKDLARIPIVKNIQKYAEIGQQLLDLHINYEEVAPYDGCKIVYHNDNPSYKVKKIRFKSRDDHSVIKFNSDITIEDIPERAYDYIVNGRSAIEWILDQYQVKTDKASQIIDDPNEYSDNPKYIFNLLLKVITVSLKTLDLVADLPKFEVAQ